MPTVALAAIVKNEAPVVRRMLDSVRPFIAAWCVVDTGSTDGTQAIVREAMAGMPGELHERPWVNFGANRSESIALARPLADYLLLVDADDTVQADSGFTWDGLTEDVGRILVRDRSTSYWRAHLLSTRKPFRFDGVVHESVACDAPTTSQALTGITYHRGCDGARSTDPNKFKRDAEALETAFATDPTNARTTFYVAQSWRDFGELEKAVSYYRRRVQMGGWAEEAWYALFQVAVLLDRLNKPPSEVVEAYLLAHAVRPSRAEPLCALARYHRLRNEWQPAYNCAARAMRIPKPEGDILFIDESVAWRARDEFALAAYWLGKRNESRRANEALLASSDLPTEQRARIEKNLSFTKPTDNAAAFSRIYETSAWGGGSGPGSDPANATAYLARLRAFIRTHSVKSIVDLGCGDWRLMREVDLTEIDYLGIDVVPSVVDTNNARFGGTNIRFECLDATSAQLPRADLLICKDVLQHLSNDDALRITNQAKRFKWVLFTNDVGVNDGRSLDNVWRYAPIDLRKPPFDLDVDTVAANGNKLTCLVQAPRVLVAILAKQAAGVLPLYLRCIEALDYPTDRIDLWVRTNNNTDATAQILRDWIERVGDRYHSIAFDDSDAPERVERFDVHEWNAERFHVLAAIRQQSMNATLERGCNFYFVADCDNFVKPNTLRRLIEDDAPIVAPLLRHADYPKNRYGNYHAAIDANGYYQECAWSDDVLHRKRPGVVSVPVVHCTYLVRADAIPKLTYTDGSRRYEYVIFSDSARRAGVLQMIDNTEDFGCLTFAPTFAETSVQGA